MTSSRIDTVQSPWCRASAFASRRKAVALVFLLAVLLIVPLLPVASAVLSPPPVLVRSATAPTTATSTTLFPTPIHHVFVIFLENADRSAVLAHGPFERYLARTYAQAANVYGACHPSAPNYLAATSGETLQCGSDGYNVYSDGNLGTLLGNAGITNWAGYMESMPTPCDTSNARLYAVHHDPFLYYANIVDNRTFCDQHVVGLNVLNQQLANGTPPSFAWITPNDDDNGHNTSVAYADHWLDGFLSPLINTTWFNSSVFFVAYDEGAKSSRLGYNGTDGGNIYFAAVSPFARPGFTLTTDSTDYNLLSTIEWLLGLGSTGHNDGTSAFPALRSLFNFTTTLPPGEYPVSGTVRSPNGSALAGAEVVANGSTGSAAATTNASGGFSLALPNGTFELIASAPGLVAVVPNVAVGGGPVKLGNITLGPPHYAVVGRVTNADSGAAIPNATVTVSNSSGPARTATNATGGFSLSLPNGTFEVSVSAAGFSPTTRNVTVAGAPIDIGNLSLGSLTFPAWGRVTSSASGAAIANASVNATTLATSLNAATNASGGFSFSLPNGTYEMMVSAPGFLPRSTNLTVAGAPIDLGNISLQPRTYRVDGSVVSSDLSLAIPNATVNVSTDPAPTRGTTNASGEFTIEVPPGSYRVTVSATGYVTANESLLVGSPNVSVVYTLVPVQVYNYTGTVVQAETGAPIVNATIVLVTSVGNRTFQSSPNGSFSLSLPNGSYQLVVKAPGFSDSVVLLNVSGTPDSALTIGLTFGRGSVLPLGLVVAIGAGAVGSAVAVVRHTAARRGSLRRWTLRSLRRRIRGRLGR